MFNTITLFSVLFCTVYVQAANLNDTAAVKLVKVKSAKVDTIQPKPVEQKTFDPSSLQPKYELKGYRDEETSHLYWPKNKPMYIYVSDSDDSTNLFALHPSNASKNHADPMYLDTEGVNYFRSRYAVDKKTGKTVQPQIEVTFPIYADGYKPRTSFEFKGGVHIVDGIPYVGGEI